MSEQRTRRAGPARSLAIYLPDLSGGGAERLHLSLAPLFRAAGFSVTLLLDRRQGQLLDKVPEGVSVVVLEAARQIRALPRLTAYLRRARPDILMANMEHMNVMALVARRLARVPTKVIVCQHNTLSEQAKRASWQFRALPFLYRIALPAADGIVAVSHGVALDMNACASIAADRVTVIHNGAIKDDFDVRLSAPAPDLWPGDQSGARLIAVGRMVAQKDYPTLLAAFARASRKMDMRLLILGEGPERAALTAICKAEGIAAKVAMPGFVDDPLPLIAAADALVLSSRFEGFGLVIAEALACGTKVVSTDCPHGPAEILDGGRFGVLVPVGNLEALSEALVSTITMRVDRAGLIRRGRTFSFDRCADNYVKLFERVLARSRAASFSE